MNSKTIETVFEGGRILLPGVPGTTSRGFLGYCSIFLFRLDNRWALFDTGHQSDRHLLLTALKENDLVPDDIQFVVLSHLHFDHSLNLPIFRSAEVFIAKAELDYAESVTSGQLDDPSIPDHWDVLLDGRVIHQVDETMDLTGSMNLKLLPGHTPGCMALFREDDKRAVVCGDVIKNAWDAVEGRSDMALAGEEAAAVSIRHITDWADIILPGHDRPFLLKDQHIIYQAPFHWQVRTSMHPQPRNEPALEYDFSPDPEI